MGLRDAQIPGHEAECGHSKRQSHSICRSEHLEWREIHRIHSWRDMGVFPVPQNIWAGEQLFRISISAECIRIELSTFSRLSTESGMVPWQKVDREVQLESQPEISCITHIRGRNTDQPQKWTIPTSKQRDPNQLESNFGLSIRYDC